MASWSVSVYDDSVTMRVSGVSKGDSVLFYIRYASSSSALINEAYTASGTSISKTFYLSPGTYAANIQINNGTWLGRKDFEITGSSAKRPSDWYWSGISAGRHVENLTASQWRSFCDRIDEFREYKGLRPYGFTYVSRGDTVYSWIVNEARDAISEIPGRGSLPSRVYSGDPVEASFFDDLAYALNCTD